MKNEVMPTDAARYCKCAFTDPDGTFVSGESCVIHPDVVPKRHPGPTPKRYWRSLADDPPTNFHPRIIVTNDPDARDSMGAHSHIWLVHMVHLQDDGKYSAFDDYDMKIHNLTHWRPAIVEDWS